MELLAAPIDRVGGEIRAAVEAGPGMEWLESAWRQVLARDATADGRFVYAVTSTGIVCRPSCPSRRPSRKNVRFFPNLKDAMAVGYRACLRCQPGEAHRDARVVAKLCAHLQTHIEVAVTLDALGRLAGKSAFTTQRLFRRVMGVSPRQYQIGLRAEGLRRGFAADATTRMPASVTDAIYDAGYSGPSRLYSSTHQVLGMKPTDYRDGGRGEMIEACVTPCAQALFGFLLVAQTERGICHVAFDDNADALESELRRRFPRATLRLDATPALLKSVEQVLSLLTEHPASVDLPFDLRATAFQQRVWQALRAIPRGGTRSYRQVAEAIGQPSASRAVARACASNPVALLVPCHRVVGSDGNLRGYRWGKQRKQELLALESRTVAVRAE